jgi:phenylacetate-CoA ligase
MSVEMISRDELAQLQLERLQSALFRAYRNVSFYRKKFDTTGFIPEDMQTLDELVKLSFTTRTDICAGYPYDMLAVPLREVVRLQNSTWTAGSPAVCAYTQNDMRHWIELVARYLTAAGVHRDDVVQIFFSGGGLHSSLGFHSGAEKIGAAVIPISVEGAHDQLSVMQDFKTTVVCGTAGDALQLAEVVSKRGMDRRRLSLRVGIFGREPWNEEQRKFIEESLGIVALDHYSISEFGGPGIAGECDCKCGLHIAEDHFIAEIIDPETGKVLPDGTEGELVLTTLTREALPLIRYRTRDITTLTRDKCSCGRTFARMNRIKNRNDGLVIAQGKRFYPQQIAAILTNVQGAKPLFQLIIERINGVEKVEIIAELSSALSADSPGKIIAAENRMAEQIRENAGIEVHIRLVERQTISRILEKEEEICDKR